MLAQLRFNREAMAAATRGGFLTATDLADYLAQGGMPFRSAHEVVGRCVAHCEKAGINLWDLSLQELRKFSPAFGADALACLSVEASVKSRRSQGGTAPVRVRTALRAADRPGGMPRPARHSAISSGSRSPGAGSAAEARSGAPVGAEQPTASRVQTSHC